MIGIDTNTWLVFEGATSHGRGVWPTPVITLATLITSDMDWKHIPAAMHIETARLIFREDSFDPVTRIRRGRFYEQRDGVNIQRWLNAPHHADPINYSRDSATGRHPQNLVTLHSVFGLGARIRNNPSMLVVLGLAEAPTVWRIISAEKTPSGEDLVTLRARSSFGVLPEIIEEQIPQAARPAVRQELDQVASGAFSSGAISLIDLCRNAAVVFLGHWLVDLGRGEDKITRDLARLIRAIPDEFEVTRNAAFIINRMHTRGKSNARQEKGLRPPTDEDAETALNCLGMILREIGWAR